MNEYELDTCLTLSMEKQRIIRALKWVHVKKTKERGNHSLRCTNLS